MASYLGLDYGLRRIGIAAGDSERRLAFALRTHSEGGGESILAVLRALIAERDVVGIVVGLPLTAAGGEGGIAERARRFAERLRREFALEVVLWDERYSSREADRWLPAGRPRDGRRDALAAEIILQSYLDHLAAGTAGPDAGDPA